MNELFVERTFLRRDRIEREDVYPFSLAPVRALDGLRFAQVTYFIGENGSGKSTILEALAVAMGLNAEGGTQNMAFSTRSSESPLHQALRVSRSYRRPQNRFFLRAESFFNVGTEIERLDEDPTAGPPVIGSYGGRSLHEQSHGESFLALIKHRFGRDGLYILDEPEAALSPTRQLTLLSRMHDLVENGSQFIIATHAPIVLAYPGATIYVVGSHGISEAAYEETDHVRLTRDFLNNREPHLRRLLGGCAGQSEKPADEYDAPSPSKFPPPTASRPRARATPKDLECLERFLARVDDARSASTGRERSLLARGIWGWLDEFRQDCPPIIFNDELVQTLKRDAWFALRKRPRNRMDNSIKLQWLQEIMEGASIAEVAARAGTKPPPMRKHLREALRFLIGQVWLDSGGQPR